MADFSIPAQVKVPDQNPLAMVGQFAQTQNALNQNKLFQQQFGAQQALGQAISRHTDPNTGQTDYGAVMGDIGGDPRANYLLPQIAQQNIERQSAQTALQGSQLELAQKQSQAAAGALFPLAQNAASGKPIDDDAVHDAYLKLSANPMFQTEQGQKILLSETTGLLSLPPEQRGNKILQYYLQFNATPAGVQAALGSPQLIDQGGSLVPAMAGGMQGFTTASEPIPKTLTPAEKAAPRPAFINGQPATVPTSSVVDEFGRPRMDGGTAAAAQGAGLPAGALPTGPRLGAAAAADIAGSQNAQQAIGLQQRAAKVPDNKALLGNMEARLDSFDPGPQSQWWKTLGQLGAEYGIKLPGAPPASATAAQEEFGKMAFQLAQSQFQALGGTGTDSKLDSTMHTSPSELLSRYGNKGIIHILKGNEDAIQAQNDAWQRYQDAGNGPESYGKFLSQWNKLYDPRVFQSQYLNPQERQQMLKGMTPAEQAKFGKSLSMAQQLGWIQ